MLDAVVSVAGFVVIFVGIVFVHEFGHYYAGRRIVGIPPDEIRIAMTTFPQYVALRDEDGEWVAPTEYDRYREAYARHDSEGEDAERYIAAGEIVQAAVVVPAAVALGLAGFDSVATSLVVISLITTLVYVLFDAGLTLSKGQPMGDYSALWQVDRRAPVLLLVGFVLFHLGTFAIIG